MFKFGDPAVRARQKAELDIVTALVDAALAKGYTISVDNGDNDGREFEIGCSSDREAILAALFETDDERLYFNGPTGTPFGWAYLVYGNDGYDVISDYTARPEIKELIEKGKVAEVVEAYGG